MINILLQAVTEPFRIGMIWDWICQGIGEFLMMCLILGPIIFFGMRKAKRRGKI